MKSPSLIQVRLQVPSQTNRSVTGRHSQALTLHSRDKMGQTKTKTGDLGLQIIGGTEQLQLLVGRVKGTRIQK